MSSNAIARKIFRADPANAIKGAKRAVMKHDTPSAQPRRTITGRRPDRRPVTPAGNCGKTVAAGIGPVHTAVSRLGRVVTNARTESATSSTRFSGSSVYIGSERMLSVTRSVIGKLPLWYPR